jgi:S1-C subfamily serine protease
MLRNWGSLPAGAFLVAVGAFRVAAGAFLVAAAANLGAQEVPVTTSAAAASASTAGTALADARTVSAPLIDLQRALRHVAETVAPAVVKLDTVASGQDRPSRVNLMPVPGVGSGVLVRRDGDRHFVLTNHHVVRDAERIVVTLSDERSFPGEVVGADTRMDLAMVAVRTPDDLPLALLGDSDSLRAGDLVLAVGSPFGLDATLTLGIVSAVGRSGGEVGNISDFIQTDASMNPGSSGGALVNISGQVVGINTWIQAQRDRWAGVGFALPINNVKPAIDQLIEVGSVRYAWLGVVLAGPDIVDHLAPGRSGAVLFDLFDGEPAQRAGLRPGDVVLAVDGREVADSDDLISAIVALEPGRPARFRLLRDGVERAVVVWPGSDEPRSGRVWPGLRVQPMQALTEQAQATLPAAGVFVSDVQRGTAAAQSRLRRQDVIVRIDGDEVSDLRDFYRLIDAKQEGVFEIQVWRDDREVTVRLNR